MAKTREMRQLMKAAEAQGFAVSFSGGGHYRIQPPDEGHPLVFVPSTPGGGRALNNTLALLRRSGFREEK